jgi:hypothetical protein
MLRLNCYAGVDDLQKNFAHGYMASLNLYDYALADFEFAAAMALTRPANASFVIDVAFPRRMPANTSMQMLMYTPFVVDQAVSLLLTSSVPGVLDVTTLVWTAGATAPLSVVVTLPTGVSNATISFAAIGNARFLTPQPVVVILFAAEVLLAECAHTATLLRPAANAGYLPSAYTPGIGVASLNGAGQFIDLNNITDTNTNQSSIDVNLVTRGGGWTVAGFYSLTAPASESYLYSMWRSASPDTAFSLRTTADGCLLFAYPDIRMYPWQTNYEGPVYRGYSQWQFGCGLYPMSVYFHLALVFTPNTGVLTVYLNSQLIAMNRIGSATYGKYDNHRGQSRAAGAQRARGVHTHGAHGSSISSCVILPCVR